MREERSVTPRERKEKVYCGKDRPFLGRHHFDDAAAHAIVVNLLNVSAQAYPVFQYHMHSVAKKVFDRLIEVPKLIHGRLKDRDAPRLLLGCIAAAHRRSVVAGIVISRSNAARLSITARGALSPPDAVPAGFLKIFVEVIVRLGRQVERRIDRHVGLARRAWLRGSHRQRLAQDDWVLPGWLAGRACGRLGGRFWMTHSDIGPNARLIEKRRKSKEVAGG